MDKAQLVAIYVRVSSTKQVEEGYSLDAQERVLRDYFLQQGKTVFKVYKDEGISGSRYDRPGLQALLKDSKKGLFGCVGIWKISRISRDLLHLLKIIDVLKNADVNLFSLTERFDLSTPLGNFIVQMFGSMAQMQRETISQNIKIGSRQRAKSGKFIGSAMFGYKSVPDTDDPKGTSKYVICPEEAEVVRKIYDLYCQGNGLKVVARTINEQGYRSKQGNAFSITGIHKILTNQAYIGKVKYAGEYFDGVHEAIISGEQWDTAQKLLASKKSYEKTVDYQYLLPGLVKCRECGSWMVPWHSTRKNKNGTSRVYYYYTCGRYLNKGTGNCKPNVVKAKEADKVVMDFIVNYLSTKEWQEKVIAKVKEKLKASANEGLEEYIQQLRGKIGRLKAKQDKLLYEYEEGQLTKEQLVDNDKELQANIDELEMELLLNQSMDHKPGVDEKLIKKAFRALPALIRNSKHEEKLKLIRNVVKAVYVDEGRNVEFIEIYVPKPKTDIGIETLRINIKEKEE